VDSLALLAEKPLEAAYLIVEAGDLKKVSLLRKTAEAARSVMTIPSYADDSLALNALIDTELSSEKLGITPAARHALIALIGGDRIASRNE
ncbi:DNA polymerase III subunit delta, partial [Rhizobium ruizarguesonis]